MLPIQTLTLPRGRGRLQITGGPERGYAVTMTLHGRQYPARTFATYPEALRHMTAAVRRYEY